MTDLKAINRQQRQYCKPSPSKMTDFKKNGQLTACDFKGQSAL